MMSETTTDTLAEIEGQAEPQPVQIREGRWRTRGGDIRHVTRTSAKDERAVRYSWHDADHDQTWLANGRYHTDHTESPLDLWAYLGPIEPEPQPEPEPQAQSEAQADYTPPEGWRLLQVGEVLEDEDWIVDTRDGNGCPTMKAGSRVGEHQIGEHQLYIRRIEVEPEPFITPDDVAAEALAGVHDSAVVANPFQAIRELLQRNNKLATQGSQQYMQIEELRSEVSYVQGLLGEEKRRVVELETLIADLRAVNAATEKAVNSAARDKADLQHRLDVVSSEWAVQAGQISGLQTQLEAVKGELVRQCENSRLLQIEQDAREQVPQAVSDRFEEGWDAGTARAVETIAEWTEPFRTCGSQSLALAVLQNLPHIMRTLTGLADND